MQMFEQKLKPELLLVFVPGLNLNRVRKPQLRPPEIGQLNYE